MSDESETTFTNLGVDVRKADTRALVTNATESVPPDTFDGLYWDGQPENQVAAILEPAFKPSVLMAVTEQNNLLLQCVEVMEVNVDGTGHSIDLIKEDDSPNVKEKEMLEEFFTNPYPGKSLPSIRRAIRRDSESTGMGYMEVIRSADDKVVMLNHVEANDVRLVRYDSPVEVDKTVVRSGKEISVRLRVRERRYVQVINGKKTFFKEFGASRDIDRNTGKWAEEGERVHVSKRGSEIILFPLKKQAGSPYSLPRWINQLPSALGSRKAEEFNLEFFDGGGVPPVVVFIEGGTLGIEVREALKAHLSGKGKWHRAAIVEAISTSGTLEAAGSVRVKVERFGGDSMKDAMFQEYDRNCEEHIRVAFRLPPIFLGKAADYSFASAYTSYVVAEAQVFRPEREEFDQILNQTVCKALGAVKYKFRSLPLTIIDADRQIASVELAAENDLVDGAEIITTLNDITGLALQYREPKAPPAEPGAPAVPARAAKPKEKPAAKPAASEKAKTGTRQNPKMVKNPYGTKTPTEKSDEVQLTAQEEQINKLASEWVDSLMHPKEGSADTQSHIVKKVEGLSTSEGEMFDMAVSRLWGVDHSGTGVEKLCGCAVIPHEV